MHRMVSYTEKANTMRREILDIGYKCGRKGIHFGGILSLVEMMLALYDEKILDLKNDKVVLSKGHGALAQYIAMKDRGMLSEEDVSHYKEDYTLCSVHPSRNVSKGIDFSSGSLGQGLSLGCGIAMSKKRFRTGGRVYVILGDGECDEGSVWEAAMLAAQWKLDNLIAVIDANGIQYDGPTNEIINISNLTDRFRSFGWFAADVDGHDTEAIMERLCYKADSPMAIVAHTVKGKGISFMEGNPLWHNKNLTQEQYDLAMGELRENEV